MTSLNIHSKTHNYEVVIEKGIRFRLDEVISHHYRSVMIITDQLVGKRYLQDVVQSLSQNRSVSQAVVPAGEASKNLSEYENLLNQCFEARLDRSSLIIALGGGMIGDLAGFVASTYLRGIDFIQMPTTILAHDSSVGGKVAVNHSFGKNLIGSFYNPVKVIYDLDTLKTLPLKEVRSGYGEVIKHALLSDSVWFEQLTRLDLSVVRDEQLAGDLEKGIKVKSKIVEKDERETSVRQFLNLGHTLAHAIEAEAGYGEITHGEAVVVGTAFALQISTQYYKTSLPVIDYVNWMKRNEYPVNILKKLDASRLIERMKRDKKTLHESIHYVMLPKIGEPEVVPVQDEYLLNELKRFIDEVNK